MSKTQIMIAVAVGLAVFASGCGSPEQPAPTKEQFKKTAPPPQWRGPGQPGGPSDGPVGGAPTSGASAPPSK